MGYLSEIADVLGLRFGKRAGVALLQSRWGVEPVRSH